MRQTSTQPLSQPRSRRALANGAVLCLLLAALPAGTVRAEPAGEQTATELRALVDQLVASVLAGDDAGVDDATCLGDMIHANLLREQALGLVADARDPELVAERTAEARAAVHAFVERLLEDGGEVEGTDASRVELFTTPEQAEEALTGQEDEELEITGSGVLGIKMLASQRKVDVDVLRLRERWCLNPHSMQ